MYIQPPPSPQHNYMTMHAFSICATAFGKRPPAPLYHTVQVTVLQPTTTTTTATTLTTTAQITMHAFSICATALGKKTDHQCKLLWAWSSTSTLQTTACAKEYMCTVVEDKDHQRKLQRVKTTPPPLACTMQQALVTCIRGMPLNFCPYPQFNCICSYASLHVLAASCMPMVAV